MLKFLRQKTVQKRIYLLLAVMIIPAFVVWGVHSGDKDKNDKLPSTLGRNENRKISLKEYLASYKAVEHQLLLMYGEKSRAMHQRINVKGEAWDRILLLDYAKKQNLNVSDEMVIAWLSRMPFFLRHGQFDPNGYKAFVERDLHMNPRDFEEEIRQTLAIQKIEEKLASHVQISDEELKKSYEDKYREMDLIYGTLPWEKFKDQITVEEKDIEQVYSIVKDKLTSPEKIKIKFLLIPKENEAALKGIFEATGTLDELSKKFNVPVQESGLFTKEEGLPSTGLSPEIIPALFSLELNKETDWLRLSQGAYKLVVTEKIAEKPLSAEDAKEEVKKLVLKQKGTDKAIETLTELKNKLTDSDLEKALTAQGIAVNHLEKYKAGDAVASLGAQEMLPKIMKSLKEGDMSTPFITPNGATIVKLVKIGTADMKKFDAEKDALKSELMSKKVSESFQTLLEDLRKKLEVNLDTMKKLFAEEADQI